MVGQHAAVDEVLSGRQNLVMFGRLYHLGAAEAVRRADELLERFGLADTGRKPVSRYSGGMRRRLDLAVGLAIAWRWHHGLGAALGAIGLRLRSPESVMILQILVWPVGFLSGAFVSPQTMPGWLGAIAEANPLSATVFATRELFGNPGTGGETWMA